MWNYGLILAVVVSGCGGKSTERMEAGVDATPEAIKADAGGDALPDVTEEVSLPVAPLRLYNTGVDTSGAPLAGGSVDPHYTLIRSLKRV